MSPSKKSKTNDRQNANARRGLVIGVLTLGTLCAGILLSWVALKQITVFGPGDHYTALGNLDRLVVADVLLVKAAHAEQAPRYDVGLFGNSRAVEVASSDLGLAEGTFFNFAVGGTAFSQSVVLLEYLASIGKTPKLAIVSLDNHDIGFYGRIYWPLRLAVSSRFATDGGVDRLRQWRHSFAEALAIVSAQLREQFNYVRVRGVVTYLGAVIAGQPSMPSYRADGSRRNEVLTDKAEWSSPTQVPGERTLRELEKDFARLAAIQKLGTRIVVYESPIHPKLQNTIENSRPDGVRQVRERVAALCALHGITCLPAPVLTSALPWADCCHAPPSLVGRFLARIL